MREATEEMRSANEAAENARKTSAHHDTGLATNAVTLLQFMRPHLLAMLLEAVEKIEAEVQGTRRQTEAAPTRNDTH